MVSIDFAIPKRGLPGRLLPTGLPHEHPRISNILGHGYKLMAISLGLGLWRFACAVAKAQAMAVAGQQWPCSRRRQWPHVQSHGHGTGPKRMARKGSESWHRARGNVPKPQAMAIALGRGSRPWPWLGSQAYGQGRVHMGIGYRVRGIGYWVVWWVLGIGYW